MIVTFCFLFLVSVFWFFLSLFYFAVIMKDFPESGAAWQKSSERKKACTLNFVKTDEAVKHIIHALRVKLVFFTENSESAEPWNVLSFSSLLLLRCRLLVATPLLLFLLSFRFILIHRLCFKDHLSYLNIQIYTVLS